MNNENLVQQLDELMGMHRQLKTDGNDILSKVRGALIKKSSDDYEKGLNDAWELARKISGDDHPYYYSGEELRDIFGSANCTHVFNHYSYGEALAKVQEYEKKKAEEAVKLVPGDVVTYGCESWKRTGIFLFESLAGRCYWVLVGPTECPQQLSRDMFHLVKTGKHVDMEGLFKGIKDE